MLAINAHAASLVCLPLVDVNKQVFTQLAMGHQLALLLV